MKNILCISILVLVLNSVSIKAQQDQDISNTEIFCNKTQSLIEKNFIEIGNVDMIDLRFMKCLNISTGEKVNALRFEYQTTSQVVSQTKLAIVDEDEISALSNAVKKIIEFTEAKEENYTELTFRCRSGFVAGAYFDPGNQKWITYIQMNRKDSKSTVTISKEEFKVFLEYLEKTRDQLK